MGCILVTTEKDLNQMKQRMTQQSAAKQSSQTEPIQQFVQTAKLLAEQAPAVLPYYYKHMIGRTSYELGKLGEQIAEKVLEQGEGLKIVERTTARGVDIRAERQDKVCVAVEVKTSIQDKSFSHLLGTGYGHKQCSDEWLRAVGVDLGSTKIDVLGVHINPEKETVSIYRRGDSFADNWYLLRKDIPLSEFNF